MRIHFCNNRGNYIKEVKLFLINSFEVMFRDLHWGIMGTTTSEKELYAVSNSLPAVLVVNQRHFLDIFGLNRQPVWTVKFSSNLWINLPGSQSALY